MRVRQLHGATLHRRVRCKGQEEGPGCPTMLLPQLALLCYLPLSPSTLLFLYPMFVPSLSGRPCSTLAMCSALPPRFPASPLSLSPDHTHLAHQHSHVHSRARGTHDPLPSPHPTPRRSWVTKPLGARARCACPASTPCWPSEKLRTPPGITDPLRSCRPHSLSGSQPLLVSEGVVLPSSAPPLSHLSSPSLFSPWFSSFYLALVPPPPLRFSCHPC